MGCYIIDFFVFNLKSEALDKMQEKLKCKPVKGTGIKKW
jgi:hypothetical protein